jgi:hypothetical protein
MDMAGRLLCTPGAAGVRALRSTRQAWAPVLTRGRAADELPALLSSLFALCGGAHRLAAELAVQAARGDGKPPDEAQREALRLDTLREHLRRWWLDGAGLATAGDAVDPAVLAICPVMQPAGRIDDAASQFWLLQEVFGQDASAWLQAWESSAQTAASLWSGEGGSWPARALRALRLRLGDWSLPLRALPAEGMAGSAAALLAHLQADADFALRPLWQGQPAETGPWTRAAELGLSPQRAGDLAPVWMRAAARVADVARLTVPGGGQALVIGSAAPAAGLGVSWCEMARGLLVHVVQLDDQGRVGSCHVLAPTEWNFHPLGVVAQAVGACDPQTPELRLQALATAFDPCVEFVVSRDTPAAQGATHA